MNKELEVRINEWAERNAQYIVKVWRTGPSCDCHTDDKRLELIIQAALTQTMLSVRAEIEANP